MPFSVRPLAFACAFAFVGVAHAADQQDAVALKRVEVSASTLRMPQSQGALPTTITVITHEDLRQQLALTPDLGDAIGNLVPSFSPSTQKLSTRGQTLRGRNPLYMIDGVPQSSPLRNGSRDGYTIDPAMIERIEIVEGSNAMQGLGAAGGIINIITKQAPKQDGVRQEVTVDTSAPTPRQRRPGLRRGLPVRRAQRRVRHGGGRVVAPARHVLGREGAADRR